MIFDKKEITLIKTWYERATTQHWGGITAQIPEEVLLLEKIGSQIPIHNTLITQRVLKNWMDKSTDTSEELLLKDKILSFF